jgi:hypothetical protein
MKGEVQPIFDPSTSQLQTEALSLEPAGSAKNVCAVPNSLQDDDITIPQSHVE